MGDLIVWQVQYVLKSIQLDLSICAVPEVSKTAFFLSKYWALVRLGLTNATAPLSFGNPRLKLNCKSVSNVGSAQSSLVDLSGDLAAIHSDDPTLRIKRVVDVGANVGQFWLATRTLCPDAEILSIEPDPNSFELLRANVGECKFTELQMCGIGAESAELIFNVHPLLSSMSSFAELAGGFKPIKRIPVKVQPLDLVLAKYDCIDLLKIDVEGWELNVIQGGGGILSRVRYILIEMSIGRESDAPNLRVLSEIHRLCPESRIIRIGRSLGGEAQDFLIKVRG